MYIKKMKSLLGSYLKNILVDQLSVYQRSDGWEYQYINPVLHFQSATNTDWSLYWNLSWLETEEGDDQLLIEEADTVETLSCFEQVDWSDQPLIVSSSIQLEKATVKSVIAFGYKDEEKEFLTAIVLKLENQYVTFYSGPVFTMTVTIMFPEMKDRELSRVED